MSLSQLGLKWTCVGILRGSNWDLFWDVCYITIFMYDYNYEIVMFDGPIDALMQIVW